MKLIGNLIWFLAFGLWTAIIYFLLGIVLCVSIIGIPFGLQFFKLARLSIWPYGSSMGIDFDSHPIMNLIWIFCGGGLLAFMYLFVGILLCITVVGIPFANVFFKISSLAFTPFGATVV